MFIFLWSTCAQHVLNFCSHVLQYLINVVVFSLLVNSGGSAQPATQSGQTPQNAHTQATVSTGGDYQESHQVLQRSGQTPQNGFNHAASSIGVEQLQVLQRSGQSGLLHNTPFPTIGPGLSLTNILQNPGIIPG